jgi:ABC-2 type transport system permease protein
MSLRIMYLDELKGFYKSRVMAFMWIGLPLLSVLLHFLRPDTKGQMSLALFSTYIVTSVSGTLASIMLVVGIIHEKSKGVYPLFLVRPVKRSSLLLGKFFAVGTCIAAAAVLTIAVGMAVDHFSGSGTSGKMLAEAGQSLLTAFSMMAVSSSAGILIGVLSPSVLVGVILILYGGNQLAALSLLPVFLKLPQPWWFSLAFGAGFAALFLYLAVAAFNKKQF